MAIGFVDSTSTQNTLSSQTTVTPDLPTHAEDDLLVLGIISNSQEVLTTTPSGYTFAERVTDSTTLSIDIYWKIAGPSETAPTAVFGANGRWVAMMAAYTGVDATTPFLAESGQGETGSSGTTVHSAPAQNNTDANAWGLFIASTRAVTTPASWTPLAGMTERVDHDLLIGTSSNIVGLIADTDGVESTGSKTYSGTSSAGTATAVMWAAMLAPASGAGSQDIAPSGIATAGALGSATVTPGAVSVAPSGVATAQAFGTAVVAPVQNVAPTGIPAPDANVFAQSPHYDFEEVGDLDGWSKSSGSTLEIDDTTSAVGDGSLKFTVPGTGFSFAFSVLTNNLSTPAGSHEWSFWAKAEVAGAHYNVTVYKDSGSISRDIDLTTSWQQFVFTDTFGEFIDYVQVGERFGSTLVAGDSMWFDGFELQPGGDALGFPTVAHSQNVAPSGIASAEAFGSATVAPGAADIAPSGIASAEVFGTAVLSVAGGPQAITATGVASTEAFGTPVFSAGPVGITATGIASAELFGTPEVEAGVPQELIVSGIASQERFATTGTVVELRHRLIVRTPTVEERLRFLNGALQPWSVDQGISLLKIDGTYHQVRWPTDDDIASASAMYRGGYDIEVDAAEVADLTAAGYGDYIQLVPA